MHKINERKDMSEEKVQENVQENISVIQEKAMSNPMMKWFTSEQSHVEKYNHLT